MVSAWTWLRLLSQRYPGTTVVYHSPKPLVETDELDEV